MIDKTATLGQMRHAESGLGNSAKVAPIPSCEQWRQVMD
jgi:hypothetical protein